MKKQLLSTLMLSFLWLSFLEAQNTVGLLSYDAMGATPGYNLHYPHNQGNAYLLDNCGQIVHVWEEDSFKPGNGVYLDTNGDLYVCKGNGSASNAYIHAGGGGEKLEVRDWDNNLLWEYTINDSLKRMHHDIALNTNTGGVFIIAWELKTEAESIQAGRDTSQLADGELWPDYIVEVEPDGAGGGSIVWEWHAWDHLIQDYDPTKDNYGVVADHPELIDINYAGGPADWMHSNALAYNPFLDHLILNVPTFNEFWIINHNTTTAQAAGPQGDLMFRWGNPETYGAGDSTDQKLYYQHDAHWVDVPLGHPDFGKIAIFNNRVGEDFSSVHLLRPDYDFYSDSYLMSGGTFLPTDFDWSYTRPVPQDMWSTGLSSVQRLVNGNTLIAVGRFGYSYEITPDEDIVWEYVNPMIGGVVVSQGSTLAINNNLQFRMTRYLEDYPAFDGRDLTPQGYIELDPAPLDICFVSNQNVSVINEVSIFPNPANDQVRIDLNEVEAENVEVYNMLGELIYIDSNNGADYLNISTESWVQGIYFVYLDQRAAGKIVVSR